MDVPHNRIPCAVLYAGSEVQLAIEARPGRAPVTVTNTAPCVRWLCADGRLEELILDPPNGSADLQRLASELLGHGLVVAEINDMRRLEDEPASHWIATATRGAA